MIIAVNKCPQNITLKAFNLSPQIYILSLFQYSRKWMGMEMGLYVPIVSQDRGDIMAEYIINAISIN